MYWEVLLLSLQNEIVGLCPLEGSSTSDTWENYVLGNSKNAFPSVSGKDVFIW
jgi:hypothetical protein